MAGKFINTQYSDTIDNLVNINHDLINNPFYLFNDKKGTKVKYYNINKEKSTLDKGSKLSYTDLGSDSPIRFNVINDLFLYQFSKAELNFDVGDFGMTSNDITGESYILPNTIEPTEGDFFEVDHIKDSTWLFKVTDVQRDTLDNGSNVFKINWLLDRTTNRDILNNVVEEYKYLFVEQGTNIKSIVKMEKYDIAAKLDNLATSLREYFIDLFYDEKVQTFIYTLYIDSKMYDPFIIEFINRNKLIATNGDYIYIDHKIPVNKTFVIDYEKSIYHAFELCNIDKLLYSCRISQAKFIDCPTSIFKSRYENYYELEYKIYSQDNNCFNPGGLIYIMDDNLLERIITNDKYTEKENLYKNIFIKYFNKENICKEDIESIEYFDICDVYSVFYNLLFLIFCIDNYTKTLLS